MFERVVRSNRMFLAVVGLVPWSGLALAQTAGVPATPSTAAFEVVAIRPNSGASQYVRWGPSPTGYSASNATLVGVIAQAYLGILYVPFDRVKGAPAWVMTAPYDITAKADEATIQAMKGMSDAQQLRFEGPMLRAMMADRFKLAAHVAPVDIPGYALVVGKHGLKMKETPPGEPLPKNGMSFGGSWKVVARRSADGKQSGMAYFQISMAELAASMSNGANPVVDQTGLTGKYDVELQYMDAGTPDGAEASAPKPDAAHAFDWGALGLEMKPIKASRLTVVVDHIERPTEN